MEKRVLVRPNTYHDSVSLMALSQQLSDMEGVSSAVVVMGTELNKELLERVGLLTNEVSGAGPTDLVIAVGAEGPAAAEAAVARAEVLLQGSATATGGEGGGMAAPRSVGAAARAMPGARLAMISVPGAYAAREARQALEAGLDVMLYSDNVSVEEEVRLKRLALSKGLLLMGPDCGTAIIDGVGLGFANAVRRGAIGIVAASGTGAQELSCLIDRLGAGVSQIIGTGGRDLSAAVGGLMTLEGLQRLQADPATAVIALVSKPPAPAVAEQVRAAAQAGPKPVVLCLLGEESLDSAAVRAVALATGKTPALADQMEPLTLSSGRTEVCGLFSGGTLCSQAKQILGPGARLIDLGDDEYTVGRPHPMIDPTLRRQRLLEEAANPKLAVILLDIVLGYGAHPDPAGALSGAIREAVARGVAVVASVTGTEADPQGLSRQTEALRNAGAVVAPTARLAAELVAQSLQGRG